MTQTADPSSVAASTKTPPPGGKLDPTRLTSRLRWLLAVVLIADILDLLDSTITNIAAPSIVRDIGGGQSLIKWLGASYALAMGVFLVVGGRLGDRYGKRRLFLVGITGFTLASAACGLSVDPAMIIVGRLVQGSFGALLIPQGITILLAAFSREQIPRAFAAFGPAMGLSAVLGPIVAGFIITANLAGLGWRPIFLINIVLGTTGLIAAWVLLPHDRPVSHERIDAVGSGLLGAAMLTLIFGLIQGSTSGWTALPIVSLIAGGAFLIGFGFRQARAANPLIVPSLLRNRGFTSGLLLGLFLFASVSGLAYVISLFFQLVLHLTPSQAALGLAPMAAGIVIASIVCRPLLRRLGRTLVVIGLVASLAGAIVLWLTVLAKGSDVTPWMTIPAILILGVGMGICFTATFDVALGDVAHDEAGSASGALSAVQQLAGAIGSAVVTTVFFSVAAIHGGAQAMSTSVIVVAGIVVICLGLVWLLPRAAAVEEW